MQDASDQLKGTTSNDLVNKFKGLLNLRWQFFQSSLVLEFEQCVSVLQEENDSLRDQLLAATGCNAVAVAELDGNASYNRSVGDIDASYNGNACDIEGQDPLPSKPAESALNGIGDNSLGSTDPAAADADTCPDGGEDDAGTVRDDMLVDTTPPHASLHRSMSRLMSPGGEGEKKSGHRRDLPLIDRHHQLTNQVSHKHVNRRNTISNFVDEANFNRIQRLVFTKSFEIVSACVILLNTVIMALQMQYDGLQAGYDLKWNDYLAPADQTWPWMEDFALAASIFFNFLFVVELILRISAAQIYAFCQPWIWFDVIVVSLSLCDLILPAGSIPVNPGMMRVIRLVRLVRLLKLLKTMSAFDSLFLLLKAVRASIHAAVWSFGLLCTIQLIVGLFLCQILADFITDTDQPFESREHVFRYFGSFSRTMLTMFEITMGNWVVCCRILVEHVDEWFMVIFLVYRCLFCFAVLKVISAVFITETNRVLEHDDELTLMKKNRDKTMIRQKVQSLIESLDESQTGIIDWDAFENLAQSEELVTLLVPLGFEIHDLEKLFWLLQDGAGHVKIDEFLNKVGRLRGTAKSIDSQTLIKVAHRIDETIHQIFEKQGLMDAEATEKDIENKACEF